MAAALALGDAAVLPLVGVLCAAAAVGAGALVWAWVHTGLGGAG